MGEPSDGNMAELDDLRVRQLVPGVMAVSVAGGPEHTFSVSANPRTTMALRSLMDAMRIEARLASGWKPDLGRWRGAFSGLGEE